MEYARNYGPTVILVLVCLFLAYRLIVPAPHPLNGAQAPDFSLDSLQGTRISLAEHLGKDVVVLDFWASWCPPCRKGLPILDGLAQRFAKEPVKIYAVNIRESQTLVSKFVEENKLSLDVLLDDKGLVADDYVVTGIPQTVVIDKSGTIRNIHVGVSPFGFEGALEADIEAALADINSE